MKLQYYVIAYLQFLSFALHGQIEPDSVRLSVTVVDSLDKTPLVFAPVTLTTRAGEIRGSDQTDESGQVEFNINAIEGDQYFLKARYLGYTDTTILLENISSKASNSIHIQIVMTPSAMTLQGVTVTAAKPAIRYDAGKLIMSVANTPFAEGSNILEVLQKAPGVSTNVDGAITFRGKQGVMVLVDNKSVYVSGEDLARYLETIPSNEVEQIEIISNPSAKYDASGNIGVINIVTKKSREKRFNGSVQGSATYGEYFRPAANIMLTARPTSNLGLYGSYNYAGGKTLTINNSRREVPTDSAPLIFDQAGDRVSDKTDNRVKAGLDFDNGKHVVGLLVNGFYTKTDLENTSTTFIKSVQDDSIVKFKNLSYNKWKSLSANANYQIRIDSAGQLLDINLDFAGFSNNGTDNMASHFLLADGQQARAPETFRNTSPSEVTIAAGKFDYTYPFRPRSYIQTGAKYSRAKTDNDLRFEIQQNSSWVLDSRRSNHFLFDEDILAAYVDYYNYFGNSWDYGVGVRVEQSRSKGNNLTIDSTFTRNIFQLFPSGYIRKYFGNQSIMLSYNKRIDRPDYNSLNPFVFYIDNYSFWQGNTNLKPQIVHNSDVTYSYNQQVFVSLFYTYTQDVFMRLPIQNDTLKTIYNTVQNIGTSNYVGLSISLYKGFAPWWYFAGSLTGSYTKVSDERGIGVNNPGVEGFQGYLNAYNGFTLPAKFRMDVTLTVNSPSRSFWYTRAYSSLSLGVTKTFKHSSLTLNLNDIFNQSRYRSEIDYQNLNIRSYYKPETRTIRLTYSYQFGNSQIKQQRNRQTGVEDEVKRVKN